MTVRYLQGAELPDLTVEWTTYTGAAIDFTSGWSFTARLGYPGSAALVTKTAGITGAAVLPNLTVSWAAGELDAVPPDTDLRLQIVARHTASSKDRALLVPFVVSKAIT